MADHHRKIELQSPDDLQYLISNVLSAANSKIDRDLPPIEGEDKMRRRVEELVQEYISTVFHSASQNLTINGLPPTPEMINTMLSNPSHISSIEEYEPFDTRLFKRGTEAAREEEELIEEIAKLRRKNPVVAMEIERANWKEGLDADERILGERVERVRQADRGSDILGIGQLERGDDVEAAWRRGVNGLEGLKGSLPEEVAHAERAMKAEAYVLEKEKR